MPLTKRAVSPVNISRNVIPPMIQRDELQCTANGSIANLIRQLSSLSKHAENIFGEIYHDAMIIHHKSNSLQQRIDRLHAKVTQLDPSNDQASINEANMRKAFKSSMLVDQHILDRSTLPAALAERYDKCDQPPDLDALNQYRDSDIPALSLYTNPSFFFDLWKKETLKDVAERPRRVKSPGDGSKSPKKRRRQLQATGGNVSGSNIGHPDRQRFPSSSRVANNEVFSFPEEYQAPQALGLQLNFRNQQHHHQPQAHQIVAPIGMSIHHQDRNTRSITQGMTNLTMGNRENSVSRRDNGAQEKTNTVDVEASSTTVTPAESKQPDARSDLLAQIQSGIKLKKVRLAEESAAEKAALETNDVAAILKRRMDQVMGNDDSSSEEGADDDEWDD